MTALQAYSQVTPSYCSIIVSLGQERETSLQYKFYRNCGYVFVFHSVCLKFVERQWEWKEGQSKMAVALKALRGGRYQCMFESFLFFPFLLNIPSFTSPLYCNISEYIYIKGEFFYTRWKSIYNCYEKHVQTYNTKREFLQLFQKISLMIIRLKQ